MKKTIVLAIAVLIFALPLQPALAAGATAQSSTQVKAGLTAASPLYGLERLFENVQLMFTTSQRAKAKLLMHDAQKRLAELRVLAKSGNQQAIRTTLQTYLNQMNQAQAAIAAQAKADNRAAQQDQEAHNTKALSKDQRQQKQDQAILKGLAQVGKDSVGVMANVKAQVSAQALKQDIVRTVSEAQQQLSGLAHVSMDLNLSVSSN